MAQPDERPTEAATRASRRRKEDGTRVRTRGRRKTANTTNGTVIIDAETSLNSDRWWTKVGWWAIDSGNTNSWSTAKESILPVSKADILCTQETKIHDKGKVEDEKRRARTLGWGAALNLSKRNESGKASGGCSVCARKGIGIDAESTIEFRNEIKHRITHAWINGVVRGGIHV